MRFHRASWREDEPTAQNCEWFTTVRDAERCARENDGSVREFDVPTTRADLLKFLNEHLWRA